MKKTNSTMSIGVILILIGGLFLLFNFNLVNVNLVNVMFSLWPIFLITLGLSIMFKGNDLIKFLIWISLIIVIGFFYLNYDNYDFLKNNSFRFMLPTSLIEVNQIHEELDVQNAKKGVLNLNIAAGEVKLDSSYSNEVIKLDYPREISKLTKDTSGSSFIVKLDNLDGTWAKNYEQVDYFVALTENIPWDINIDSGAVAADLDLREINLNELKINSGAGSYDIYLGDKSTSSKVKIDSAASEISILIPSEVGVYIKVDSVFKDINFSGGEFTKGDGVYYSQNYENSSKKVEIDLDIAVGEINITH